ARSDRDDAAVPTAYLDGRALAVAAGADWPRANLQDGLRRLGKSPPDGDEGQNANCRDRDAYLQATYDDEQDQPSRKRAVKEPDRHRDSSARGYVPWCQGASDHEAASVAG